MLGDATFEFKFQQQPKHGLGIKPGGLDDRVNVELIRIFKHYSIVSWRYHRDARLLAAYRPRFNGSFNAGIDVAEFDLVCAEHSRLAAGDDHLRRQILDHVLDAFDQARALPSLADYCRETCR